MPTVQEVLKQTGLSDEEISKLDPKLVSGFTQVISSATKEREDAELARRAQAQQYDTEIAPALNEWANREAQLSAEVAFYKTQVEKAKEGGFVATTIPGAPAAAAVPVAGRDPSGRFVPNANEVPGSPKYMTQEQAWGALGTITWATTEYQRLNNGAVIPDSIETLAQEASANRMKLRDWVEKKYDFQKKRDEIKAAEQKKHDDSIRKETEDRLNKEFAERTGNNPAIRVAQTSGFSQISKAAKEGSRPDPLKFRNSSERHTATRDTILKEIAANESATVN